MYWSATKSLITYGPLERYRSVSSGSSVKLKPLFQKLEIGGKCGVVVVLDRVDDGLLGLFVVVHAERVLADDVSRQTGDGKASSQSTNGRRVDIVMDLPSSLTSGVSGTRPRLRSGVAPESK